MNIIQLAQAGIDSAIQSFIATRDLAFSAGTHISNGLEMLFHSLSSMTGNMSGIINPAHAAASAAGASSTSGVSGGIHLENVSALAAATSADTSTHMTWLQTIILSLVQGLTEFLPVSSSAHLRIVSQLLWGQDAGASFTAVVQLGTEAAVLVFFAKDIWRILTGWFWGLRDRSKRGMDYRMGWMVIIGTIPVSVLGFLLKDFIRDSFRNLWITAAMLILFSFVFIWAEKVSRHQRKEKDLTITDAIVMGFAQCLALIPGVSRSGGTISAGLLRNLDREAATRFSFLLAIPAVTAAGLFSLGDVFHPADGQVVSAPQLVVGTAIAFVVGYASIAWLLRFVSHHSFAWFAAYRIPLGLLVMALLATGVISPH